MGLMEGARVSDPLSVHEPGYELQLLLYLYPGSIIVSELQVLLTKYGGGRVAP
jgi:hypothetical protein